MFLYDELFGHLKDEEDGAFVIDERTVATYRYVLPETAGGDRVLYGVSESPLSVTHKGYPRERYSQGGWFREELVSYSPAMKDVLIKIARVAESDFSVILQGETGTGKTLIARYIHNHSLRKSRPFVAVDMGLVPETLIESELFGYEKGAFTGAMRQKKGFFEHADTGTIFIDELQNMNLSVQGKLLSVLDERRIYPLGASNSVNLDVRVIAAANKDLAECIKEKIFRDDLYFRLSEFIITLPPLRQRKEDIPYLVDSILIEASIELHKEQMLLISDEAMQRLVQYDWPGNIRELKNVIRRAAIMCSGDTIRLEQIDFLFRHDENGHMTFPFSLRELTERAVRNVESNAIRQALKSTAGNKSKAAHILKVDYKSFLSKLKKYGL